MEGDGLRAEGEFLVLFGLCREQLENRVLETALVSCCSAHENHEGGEYDIMILAAVQADLLSTTQHRQNSGRFGLLDSIPWVFLRLNLRTLRSGFNLNVFQQLVSVITAKRHFLCCHIFPVVSELDYLLLEPVVFSDDLATVGLAHKVRLWGKLVDQQG